MKQREVQTQDKVMWICVEALGGIESLADEQAKTSIQNENENETVAVVCTPSGGEQSIRLQLPPQWHDDCSDDEMTDAISTARMKAE